eukprot:m.531753 g.531753  ORF g.531753 m.531753 type:complete len:202 (-) comp57587_c0_seq2:198-803(-)
MPTASLSPATASGPRPLWESSQRIRAFEQVRFFLAFFFLRGSRFSSLNSLSKGVVYDPWMLPLDVQFSALHVPHQPILFQQAYLYLRWRQNFEPLLSLFRACNPASRFLTLRDTGHLNFTDMLWHASFVLQKIKKMGPLDRSVCISAIRETTLTFLREKLSMSNGAFTWDGVSASDVFTHHGRDTDPILTDKLTEILDHTH